MQPNRRTVEPFDEHRRLRNGWQWRIRFRLEGLGGLPFEDQCGWLAGKLGVDPRAIWALLLWNTGVSTDAAARLRAWVQGGMPIDRCGSPPRPPAATPRQPSRHRV